MLIAGPCVIEDAGLTREIASELKAIAARYPVDFVFKASYDKANRTSVSSYRGPGLAAGLDILARIKGEVGVRVLSDVHEVSHVAAVRNVLDVIQIPAFLSRQTDLVVAASETGLPVNLKKAQFMAPQDMEYVVRKAESTGNRNLLLTERGTTFGYSNLVVDFRSFSIMARFGYPVIFDATHSVQIPSQGGVTSGNREYVIPLSRSAAAYGIDGLFCEVHPNPGAALSDAANSLHLSNVDSLLKQVTDVRTILHSCSQS